MKTNKKFIAVILFTIAVVCISCTNDKKADITENEAVDYVNSLKEKGSFDAVLSEVDENVVINSYKISDENIRIIKSFMGEGASAEEIVLLKGNADKIEDIVNAYLKQKEESYESYLPKEAVKIHKAVFRQYGEFSIVCISADEKTAKKILP